MSIRCYGGTGLLGKRPPQGLNFSDGIYTLNDDLAKIAGVTCAPVRGWADWRATVSEIASRPANEGQVLFGHSMSANSIAMIAAALKRSIVLIAGFDPTIWEYTPAVTPNVHKAILFHGTNWANIVGHQKYSIVNPDRTKLVEYDTTTIHEQIDNKPNFQKIVIDAVTAAL